MKVRLTPMQEASLTLECPLCGQGPSKKCTSKIGAEGGHLIPRPHIARVQAARDKGLGK